MNRNPRYTRRSFLRTVAVSTAAAPFIARGWAARSPNSVLHHASFGADGMAWNDLAALSSHPSVKVVAVCDVDLNRTLKVRERFPEARIYQDWR
jgi:hypothetical protein